MTELGREIRLEVTRQRSATVLSIGGVLDSLTYQRIRDAVIKEALDEPAAVVVNVDDLTVPADSAWSVFASARWHVSTWPDVPLFLVCADANRRRRIAASGVVRYVPVHPTLECALDAAQDRSQHGRRRARIELPEGRASTGRARAVVADLLTAWGQERLIPTAGTVATVFVENVLAHTDSVPVLRLEDHRGVVTVAVEDCSDRLPVWHEDGDRGVDVLSGLAIVNALCRAWGATPMPTGKTVWALVGRENQL